MPAPPETFDDLQRLSRELQTPNRWGFLWQGKQYEGLITVFLEVLWGFGGDWIDADSRQVRLDQPEALRAVEFLKQSIGTISPEAVTTYAEEDTRTLFQNGRSVFLRNWPYVWTVTSQTSLRKEDRVGMAPVVHAPGQRSSATLGGWGFAISKFTRHPEAAWQFVRFLTDVEQMRKIQLRMGRIPARRSLVPAEFVVRGKGTTSPSRRPGVGSVRGAQRAARSSEATIAPRSGARSRPHVQRIKALRRRRRSMPKRWQR